MNKQEVFDKLIASMKVLFEGSKKIDYEKITMDTRLIDDLGFDSLNLIMTSLVIEREFNISISDLSISNFSTVGNIIDYIINKQNGK